MTFRMNLPGLATHYATDGRTACGAVVPASRHTEDPKRANCARCLRAMRPKKRRPSESQLRALAIIVEHGARLYPSLFAQLMWDTSSWMPHAVGKTGGAYLDRLTRMGLIEGYQLTEKGREVLASAASR